MSDKHTITQEDLNRFPLELEGHKVGDEVSRDDFHAKTVAVPAQTPDQDHATPGGPKDAAYDSTHSATPGSAE